MNENTTQHHILPLKIYLGVGMGLLFLTVVTVLAAQVNFGQMNLFIAMAIAVVKATLVAMFFMHLKYDNRIYMLIFVGSIFFLAVFIIFTMFDTLRRGDIYEEVSTPVQEDAVIYRNAETKAAPAHVAPDSTITEETATETSDH